VRRPLYVAAGGGGDALAAALLHRAFQRSGSPVITTFSWDRLIVDPLPGPRSVRDFTGLGTMNGLSNVVNLRTRPIPPAGSTLPALAGSLTGQLDATLVLLDATGGVVDLHRQLASHVAAASADGVVLVDVGGDVLAIGLEPGLRSPLGDALVLAAVDGLDVPSIVWVAGPGVDGELPARYVLSRLESVGATSKGRVPRETSDLALPILRWHPSEATALFVAAARGVRGIVDIRSGGMPVRLDGDSSLVLEARHDRVVEAAPLAQRIRTTESLTAADSIVSDACGRSEIAFETAKAASRSLGRDKIELDFTLLTSYVRQAEIDGVTHATYRRIAELTGARDTAVVRDLLLARWPDSEDCCLWRLPSTNAMSPSRGENGPLLETFPIDDLKTKRGVG